MFYNPMFKTIIFDDDSANPICGQCLAYQKLAYTSEGDRLIGLDESGPIDGLRDLYEALKNSVISEKSEYDWDELPVFGEDIENPDVNVLSWDDSQVLVWDGEGDVTLVDRD